MQLARRWVCTVQYQRFSQGDCRHHHQYHHHHHVICFNAILFVRVLLVWHACDLCEQHSWSAQKGLLTNFNTTAPPFRFKSRLALLAGKLLYEKFPLSKIIDQLETAALNPDLEFISGYEADPLVVRGKIAVCTVHSILAVRGG